jgi:hypothetical protein
MTSRPMATMRLEIPETHFGSFNGKFQSFMRGRFGKLQTHRTGDSAAGARRRCTGTAAAARSSQRRPSGPSEGDARATIRRRYRMGSRVSPRGTGRPASRPSSGTIRRASRSAHRQERRVLTSRNSIGAYDCIMSVCIYPQSGPRHLGVHQRRRHPAAHVGVREDRPDDVSAALLEGVPAEDLSRGPERHLPAGSSTSYG